jgi:hypothetical protein
VDWNSFNPLLKTIYQKARQSHAGRKPFDTILMFKLLVLQSLYNLSDDQVKYQVRDRLSFQRFLGLSPEDTKRGERGYESISGLNKADTPTHLKKTDAELIAISSAMTF